MERTISVGKIYKHYTGKKYKVLLIARDSDTSKDIVIYEALYDKHIIWAREYDKFNSLVDQKKYPDTDQKYRFEEVG